jgi:hypothetical protein
MNIFSFLSNDNVVGLASIATFFVGGWLALKILHRLERAFPHAETGGFFAMCLLFALVLLAVYVVRYLTDRHHNWDNLRDGFAWVVFALFLGVAGVIARLLNDTHPALTVILIIGTFVLFTLAFRQLFGM